MIWTGIFIGLAIGAVVGVPAAYVEVKRQIRRARDAERRARDAQRMAEIGAMTGGLAHEIKNPLSTIGLNAQLLAESISELPLDEHQIGRVVRRVDALRREAERLRDILGDFLRFAGRLRLEPVETDLNAIVEELADFYLSQARHHGVNLRTDLAPGPLLVHLDAAHFKQAVLNLLINATQSMEHSPVGSRELILRTARARPTGRGRPAGGELHVIDTGPGIPAESLDKIFAPYFTTKSGGSGLGLPTARRLIEEHGGTLSVITEPPRGSDFVIWLPAAGSPTGPGRPRDTERHTE